MIAADVFREVPVLTGPRLRLEPLGERHLDASLAMLADPEGNRLTGTHQTFTEPQVRSWLASLADRHDRADWAVIRRDDGAFLGEAVLNDLDAANASMNFRIALAGPHVFGRGYGTEATGLVVAHGLDVAGLHRIGLEVFAFNPRARRVYEKCGFVAEGVRREVLRWDGEWHDAIAMSILATDPRPDATR